jgi:hypothetical protein
MKVGSETDIPRSVNRAVGGAHNAVRLSSALSRLKGVFLLGWASRIDDTDKKGVASPIALMNEVLKTDPRNADSKESPIGPSTFLHEMGHALLILQTYLAIGQPYGEPHIWQDACASVNYQEVMSRYRALYNHDLVIEQSLRAELYAETCMVIEAVNLTITHKDLNAFDLVTDENRTQLCKAMECLIAAALEQYRIEVRPTLEAFTPRLRGPGHEIIDVALRGGSTNV